MKPQRPQMKVASNYPRSIESTLAHRGREGRGRDFVYRVAVSWVAGMRDWEVREHWAYSGSQVVERRRWRFLAVRAAKRHCISVLNDQGQNLPLTLRLRDANGSYVKSIRYAHDPREKK